MPASINRHLRDYQREGVQFLFRQYSRGKGGLLGDDMVSSCSDWVVCAVQHATCWVHCSAHAELQCCRGWARPCRP